MPRFVGCSDRDQVTLLPECLMCRPNGFDSFHSGEEDPSGRGKLLKRAEALHAGFVKVCTREEGHYTKLRQLWKG